MNFVCKECGGSDFRFFTRSVKEVNLTFINEGENNLVLDDEEFDLSIARKDVIDIQCASCDEFVDEKDWDKLFKEFPGFFYD